MLLLNKAKFHGGIHPTDGSDKLLSNQNGIREYVPQVVEISMKQSGGSLCEPVVKQGDKVVKGQFIGKSNHYGTANIHASLSGTVTDIRVSTDKQNNEVPVVIIEGSGADKTMVTDMYRNSIIDISSYSRNDIINYMKEGGIIGMGGAGFPTHNKYLTDKKIDIVLINAAECEPYLTCDHKLMLEYGYEILNGVILLIKAAGAKKAIVCLEDNKRDAAEHLSELLATHCNASQLKNNSQGEYKLQGDLSIEIRLLPTKYPQGGERQLVEAVLHKEVPAGALPADIGVIINNVATAKAVADMIFANMPLISRCVTVTGKVKTPTNFMVPIGTRFSELIKEAGGFTTAKNRVIIGGPMTGESILIGAGVEKLEGSVTKTTSCILVLEDYTLIETPCIRCGECERVCPAGLAPFKIDFAAIDDDLSLCDKLYATECISCGCCSYVCPAKRELAYRITVAKNEIFKHRREGGYR